MWYIHAVVVVVASALAVVVASALTVTLLVVVIRYRQAHNRQPHEDVNEIQNRAQNVHEDQDNEGNENHDSFYA